MTFGFLSHMGAIPTVTIIKDDDKYHDQIRHYLLTQIEDLKDKKITNFMIDTKEWRSASREQRLCYLNEENPRLTLEQQLCQTIQKVGIYVGVIEKSIDDTIKTYSHDWRPYHAGEDQDAKLLVLSSSSGLAGNYLKVEWDPRNKMLLPSSLIYRG